MVDGKPLQVEWQTHRQARSESHHRDGCFADAFCHGVMTGGCAETSLHINSLEMLAAFFVIKAFARDRQGIAILISAEVHWSV